MTKTLDQQIDFLNEIDKLKSVTRSSYIVDGSRFENSAEHSWHLALYALIFAPHAGEDVDILRVIQMLLLHDIVEIDVGDHPIDLPTDWEAVAVAEQAAAARIFGMLPAAQSTVLREIWQEFEAAQTPSARFAKALDACQPIFQTLNNAREIPDHVEIVQDNLKTGRARMLVDRFPEAHAYASQELGWTKESPSQDFLKRLAFLIEVDRLKTVTRATKLCDNSRRETSGEHSWHIAMYAWVLAEHAHADIDVARVLKMLLIHDLVEIDVGDAPIHGDHDIADIEAKEAAAAGRIFGLLPDAQGQELRALWDEFESAESDDAVFAKSVDRVQPVNANLETGGGSWVEYKVSRQQLEDRVGWKVAKGAPDLWDHLQARIGAWFETNAEKLEA
ncbi:HD domain-containing protein [Cognatishimia activa]|uniref:5'-deoxynucleotidase n=1 Tax=Cognatishimia activa TaxID=1715691 RepID=A0A975EPA2_9RHOB|nr:HD domain-containing protein [Cognatishimia activa]QTN35688.1 HD domain-containing protein [Cognatishimia activa]